MNSKTHLAARAPRHARKKAVALIISFALAAAFPNSSFAAVGYMPDVTSDMSKAAYWSDKDAAPNAALVDAEEIAAVNEAIAAEKDTNVKDLSQWSAETFDGTARNSQLTAAALEDARYIFNSLWSRYDDKGTFLGYDAYDNNSAAQAYYGPMIDNCADPSATTQMPYRFAICTTRTCIVNFPSELPLWDDPSDPDFDNRYQTMVRVNEPLVLDGKSGDGLFYHATTSCTTGWVAAADVAICADKDEWLSAWNFSADETLVVYDDKIYTEDSNYAPQVANRKLPMGTCLKLASESEWTNLITNRSAHNNHVVWMPVRNLDGSYEAQLALIGENRKVSEGFLPLTAANVALVALNQLGDVYGWGGMLGADDCSGYVRDVYKCFGLELARNTTWQAAQPVRKWDLEGMSSEDKAVLIAKLPVGAVLIFNGHEMIYLGSDAGKLYVISSVSKVSFDGSSATRIRNTVINTLDIKRTSGQTWLEALTCAQIPYYSQTASPLTSATVSAISAQTYTGKAVRPAANVMLAAAPLAENVHYTISYANNVNVGTATLTVTGKGNYEGSIKRTFKINPKATTVKKLVKGKKCLTVKWKKQATQTTGYQIRYALDKSFTKAAKTKTVKSATKTSVKIKKLKSKKTYYVQIRTYKTVGSKKYYSAWSAQKRVKTK